MILTGQEIIKQQEKGSIKIYPFDQNRVNPNSYNVSLSDKIMIYDRGNLLDMKKDNPVKEFIIPKTGIVLKPGILYLGRTVEYTESHEYAPMLEGRSSLGRLGLSMHITAGFGDIGFCGKWTLEMTVVEPLKIYPFIECCHLYFHKVIGNKDIKYNGKYQNAQNVDRSKLFKELQ